MLPSFQVTLLDRRSLSSEIMELTCEKPFDFLAGQYVFIEYEGERHPFSIASAPFETALRFHMQHSERRPMKESLWELIKNAKTLKLSAPMGEAYLRENSDRPLLFIAGGSGFAPIHSMINQLAHAHSPRTIRLYWGAESHDFIYDLQSLKTWQAQLPDFKWTLVIAGLVHQAVLEDQLKLEEFDVYIAGPFALSKTAASDFSKHYSSTLTIYSDALST
ncbi:MAG: hypothetical protein NTV32_01045 [Gammaproteobacteria bacterium]|nr:hypothetical protein [Gammaproteobacteria bacterium]